MADEAIAAEPESSLTAQAVYFTAPRTVEVRRVALHPDPDIPQARQKLVHSRLCGISHGTELLVFRDELPDRIEGETLAALGETGRYPLRYGYMNVGVTAGGRRVFAFQPHQDRFWARDEDLIEIPDAVSDEDAVLLPSVETALSVVHDAAPRYGEVVAVLGLGVIGLLVSELLLRMGMHKVIGVEPRDDRRRRASKLGCRTFEPNDPELYDAVEQLTRGRGIDVAVNTSAAASGLQLAVDLSGLHATVVEASWYGRRSVQLTLGEVFHRRRLTLKSSQVSRIDPALSGRWSKLRRLETALRLCVELHPAKYVTHRFRLDQAQHAFELLDRGPEGVLQILLGTV